MPTVRFVKAEYEPYPRLKDAVGGLLDDFMPGGSLAGEPVLIKPNLLMAATPETGVQTHPLVTRAAVEWVLDRGGNPLVADSPARGTFARIVAEGGYTEALADLDVPLRAFDETVPVDIGAPFGRIPLAKAAVETALIINLAKLKTHSQMRLTLGVKNLFGCVVGLQKPEWHLRSGVDRETFARLLLQIHLAVNPTATIIDGITALEGAGPGKGGDPRPIGVLVGGRKAVAIDAAICRMLGLEPDALPTWQAADCLGVAEAPTIEGDFFRVDGFRLPELGEVFFGPPALHGFVRRHVLNRPRVRGDGCRLCGDCRRICPAGAIQLSETEPVFDLTACIRCYCCVEICPFGALENHQPPAGRILARLSRIYKRLRPSADSCKP